MILTLFKEAVMPIFTLLASLRLKRPVFHVCATFCCHLPRPGSIMKVEPETIMENCVDLIHNRETGVKF